MKKSIEILFAAVSALFLCTSCEDWFQTNPDDIINVTDYIADDEEMYKGFMGIMTKVQEAGDHAIFLTDTRGDFLETTANAPLELQQIYNYEPTDGNSYADPAPFYSIVVACNDYMDKMQAFREKAGENMDNKNAANFNRLVSLTLRLKVWAYLKLGTIYGEAVWFDNPLEERIALSDTSVFTPCTMPQLVEHSLALLDQGVTLYKDEVIPADLEMDWAAWFNEESVSDNYGHWQYTVPTWLLLKSELLMWRGTQADYLWVRDHILSYLYEVRNTPSLDPNGKIHWMYNCSDQLRFGGDNQYDCEYYKIFFNEKYSGSDHTNFYQVVTGIMYDYENRQRNRIVEYFCPKAPGKYYLRPTTYAMNKISRKDSRSLPQQVVMNVIDGDTCFTKYYYYRGTYLRNNLVEIQPVIPLYRGHDYHFLLAEAENHLGNWQQANVILNWGITNEFVEKTLPANWSKQYLPWFDGDMGIIGAHFGTYRPLPTPKEAAYALSEEERVKIYDLAILDEALAEYTGEGRSYAYLCRMAERYGAQVVADRICPKYPEQKRAQVRAAIESGGYWVKWNLKQGSIGPSF